MSTRPPLLPPSPPPLPAAVPPPLPSGPPPIPSYQYTADGLHRWREGVAEWERVPALDELRALSQWVAWRSETVNGKPTKVPYVATNGRKADATDPATWSTYATAETSYREAGHIGLGCVVSRDDPLCGIDLDRCRDRETGEVQEWAQAIVARLDSYTEVTPSGTGLRVWIKARKGDRDRCSRSLEGGKIEIYDHDRYFTVTGQHLNGTPTVIEARQAEYEALYRELWPPQAASADPTPSPAAATDLTALQVLEIARGFDSWPKWERLLEGDLSDYNDDHSSADEALCCLAAFITRDPATIDQVVRSSGLIRPKWDEKRGASTYGANTIAKALELVTETYDHTAVAAKAKLEARHTEKVEQQRAAAAAATKAVVDVETEVEGTVGRPTRIEIWETEPARFSFFFAEHGEETMVLEDAKGFWTVAPFDLAYLQRFLRAPHWERNIGQHRKHLAQLLDQADHQKATSELTDEGRLHEFLKGWVGRAGDDPEYVNRNGVWLDEKRNRYVFKLRPLLRSYNLQTHSERVRLSEAAIVAGIEKLGGRVSIQERLLGKMPRLTWLPAQAFPDLDGEDS